MKHIELGGKSRPVHYSVNALIELADITGIDITTGITIAELRGLKNLRALAFVGLKHGLLHEGKTCDFEVEEVGNWLAFDDGSMDRIIQSFQNDQPATTEEDKNLPDAEKKNQETGAN